MTSTCHPISAADAHEMMRGVVHAVCDRPGEAVTRREARAHDVVRSVMAFEPRDAVEIMLAGLAVMHFHLLLASTHEAFGMLATGPSGRANSGIAALDRAMNGFIKELRIAQKRPVVDAVPEVRPGAPVETAAKPATRPAKESETRPMTAHPPNMPVRQLKPVTSVRDAAPGPLLPLLRRGEASNVAMMAGLTPAMAPAVLEARTSAALAAAAGA